MSHERAYDRLTVVDGLGVKFYVIPTLPLAAGGVCLDIPGRESLHLDESDRRALAAFLLEGLDDE